MAESNPHGRNRPRPIRINWAVKGYHVFHIRPPVHLALDVIPEPQNRYDPHAMGVFIPNNPNLLAPEVQHLAGRQVGRVPANLCRCLSLLQNGGFLARPIKVEFLGEVAQSTMPPVHARFTRGARGQLDRGGGGAELQATYELALENRRFRQAMAIFEANLTRADLERFAV